MSNATITIMLLKQIHVLRMVQNCEILQFNMATLFASFKLISSEVEER